MASSALQLLIDIGYFPMHINLDVLKYNVCTEFSDEILMEAEDLLIASSDSDEASISFLRRLNYPKSFF